MSQASGERVQKGLRFRRAVFEALEDRSLLSLGSPCDPLTAVGYDLQTGVEEHFAPDGVLPAADDSGDGSQGSFAPASSASSLGEPAAAGWGNTIFGTDNRTRVTTTTYAPYRSVAKLVTVFPDNTWFMGSGALVGPYHLLTAGHAVYQRAHGGWVKSIFVWLGQNGKNCPYGEARGVYAHSQGGWTVEQKKEHDWAVVTLDRRTGNTTGWFNYSYATDSYYTRRAVRSAGFPTDRDQGKNMYRISGQIDHVSPFQLFYEGSMDTAGGQSGSPVYVYSYTKGYVIHGIHGAGSVYNEATRLTQEKYNFINTWKIEDDAQRRPTDRPDLVDHGQWFQTSSSSLSKTRAHPGDSIWLLTKIRNNATAATTGTFYVSFYASRDTTIANTDYYLGSAPISALKKFSSITLGWFGKLPKGLPSGSYYIGWIIDSGGTENEFREDNNTGYHPTPLVVHVSSRLGPDVQTPEGVAMVVAAQEVAAAAPGQPAALWSQPVSAMAGPQPDAQAKIDDRAAALAAVLESSIAGPRIDDLATRSSTIGDSAASLRRSPFGPRGACFAELGGRSDFLLPGLSAPVANLGWPLLS